MAKRIKRRTTYRPTQLFGRSCKSASGTITGERGERDHRPMITAFSRWTTISGVDRCSEPGVGERTAPPRRQIDPTILDLCPSDQEPTQGPAVREMEEVIVLATGIKRRCGDVERAPPNVYQRDGNSQRTRQRRWRSLRRVEKN